MNVHNMLHSVQSIDGWLSTHEGYFLYTAAKKEKGNGEVVEIGSWKGKSTICLASGLKDSKRGKVVAVDPHKGKFTGGKTSPTYKEFLQNLKSAGIADYVSPLVVTSEEAAKNWKKPIRLLFIDGLHDYKHTYQDLFLWTPFIQKNGIVAFHDAFCGHVGPERVILEEILPNPEFSDFGVVGSIVYARKKRAQTLLEKLQRVRASFLIRLSLVFNKTELPNSLKFFLIHRVFKLLLLNKYTSRLLLE